MRIKVIELQRDFSLLRIRLPLTAFSKNMGSSMFGGYQASLADPIAALACARRFPGYSVWTRAMTIDFVREGNSDLELRFEFDDNLYRQIKEELEQTGRSTPTFEYALYRSDGEICSKVTNTVAIRPANFKSQK
jgi:acyl-coenzyme A thioesterase PaaI-like protein